MPDPQVKISEVEGAHNIGRIIQDFNKGNFRILRNRRVLRIFMAASSPKDPAFPCGDYPWWENPKFGDKCYSVLAPKSSEEYWKGKRTPTEGWVSETETYPIEIEDFTIDLKLSEVEANRFEENLQGEVDILRSAGESLRYVHPETKKMIVLRSGIRDIVMIATGELYEDAIKLENELVGCGLYSEYTWKEVEPDYLRRMSVPGGLGGPRNERLEELAKIEIRRREKVDPPDTSPGETSPPSGEAVKSEGPATCDGTTQSGIPCARPGSREHPDGGRYCPQHFPVDTPAEETATVGGDES